MKVLVITNLAPSVQNPSSGIFITRRLQQYFKYGIDFDAISLGYSESKLVLLLKSLLKKNQYIEFIKEYKGVRFKPLFIKENLYSTIAPKILSNYFLKNAEKCAKSIEESFNISEYDVIHAHGMYEVPAGLIAKILAYKYNKPFFITLHGSDVNIVMPKRRKIYTEIIESASKTIFVSNALLEKAKSLGYLGKNAVIIPNGYDERIFYPLDKEAVRKELGIYKPDYKYVGFVGNLIPIKRADKLGEIFNRIAKEQPMTYFIVVGDGPLSETIKKETKGLNVIFTGRVPQKEVARWMNAMDVMILPSREEGFGAVLIEAQACGTCVIGSSNGGIPEAIGFPEYVVDEGEEFEERFSEKVIEVLKNGYDKNKFTERSKSFIWKNTVLYEISVYKSVLNI